ncbi:MAG: YCF48-related protein [Candidatus Moraniibacteriota bacterium]
MRKKIGNIFKLSILGFLILFLSGCTIGRPENGFYKSIDSGQTFVNSSGDEEDAINLLGKNVLSMEVDKDKPGQVLVGTSSAGIYLTRDRGESWLKDKNPFGNITDIESISTENLIYISAVKEGRGKILKTEDEGENWEEIYTEKKDGPYVSALSVDPRNSDVVYIANTEGGVFKTTDGGNSWKNLKWLQRGYARKIEFDRVNPDIIYFATKSEGLFKTENQGEDFEKIIDRGDIYNVVADPNSEGTVYASTKKGLEKSVDKGEEWETLNTLTRPEELNSYGLAINPNNSAEIYYASGKAFYKTTNGGESWTPIQFNINVSIDVIKVDPNDTSVIYLGTRKRGGSLQVLPPMIN